MYTQDWSAALIGTQISGPKTVYVESDGKLGSFYGVLAVDCVAPARSQWLTESKFILEGSVPNEAIIAIRAMVC